MSRRRIRLLINPSARSGRGWEALGPLLRRVAPVLELETAASRSAAHFQDLVAQSDAAGLDAVAIAGGDGTVALALNAAPGLEAPLAILPIGSGNDFARHAGVPGSLARAVHVLCAGRPCPVDVACAAWPGRSLQPTRYCCVASVGLDELALRVIHGSRWPRCKALNIYAALRALWDYRPRHASVEWEGGRFEGEVMFVAVTNTRSYGGGFMVSPEARLDDGKLDLCIVRRAGRVRLLTQFPRILKGTHRAMREVILAQSLWVKIDGAEPLPVTLDGELPRATTPVKLSCELGAVRILTPAKANGRGPHPELAQAAGER